MFIKDLLSTSNTEILETVLALVRRLVSRFGNVLSQDQLSNFIPTLIMRTSSETVNPYTIIYKTTSQDEDRTFLLLYILLGYLR